MHRIEADALIPGRGEPVADGVVVLEGASITYSGPRTGAPETPGATVTRAAAVMPGMWDCHGHFMGARSLELPRLGMEPIPQRTARCAADLRAALAAGITSVREPGGLGLFLAPLVQDGTLPGPSIYSAGAILSTTGGHGDLHCYPLSFIGDFSAGGGELRLADGPDACMRAAREQLRRNAKLIKVCASGGVMSEVDHPIHQQFTVDELKAIVEVAGMADRVVAAHCHAKPGIMAALEAGVRTIEHGTFLDDEACAAMRDSGAVLVTTRTIIEEVLAEGGGSSGTGGGKNASDAPPYAVDKLKAIAETHAKAIALARSNGVTIAMGTDIALTGGHLPDSWGRNGRELAHLVACGLTPLEAIEAATANGPLTLGPQAPRSGRLAEGFDGDVLTLDADPLGDISVLADPGRITGVWKEGRRIQ